MSLGISIGMGVGLGGGKGQVGATIQFQTACGVGDTFDPTVVLAAGCPHTPHWSFGNGDTFDGLAVNYAAFADAGPHTITLTITDIGTWLTEIDVYNDKVTGDFFTALAPCTALTKITTGENTNLASDLSSLTVLTNLVTLNLQEHQALLVGDIADLAVLTSLTRFYCAGCGIHGDIASLAGMTQLNYLDVHAHKTTGPGNVGIYGDIGDAATLTNLTYFAPGNTNVTGDVAGIDTLVNLTVLLIYNSTISGNLSALATLTKLMFLQAQASGVVADSAPFPKLQYLYLHNNGWNQATVDATLAQLYADRASYSPTTARITLLIGLTNAAPSGAYADEDPPSTGLGYVYELVVDPEVEGFKPWTITYNGGAGANVTKP